MRSYINRALRNQRQHDRIAGLLAELEQENGPIKPQVLEEVRRAWPGTGERATKRRRAVNHNDKS